MPAVFSLLLVTFLAPAAASTSEPAEFFEKKVRPILAERCYKCHSSRSEKLKGGLVLDSREGVLRGGEAGPVLIPGAPEKSKLIEAIHYQNPDLQMPPNGKLPDDEIATLTEWVKLGAPWGGVESSQPALATTGFDLEKRRREHWAWQPIKPQHPPVVRNKIWPSTPPDRFILAKLEQQGLRPAAQADRRTLIRRLSFDLTGLPPTPEEVEDFLKDSSPKAYERVVDRLLASPHFGERWARHWLDLVRYAETLGHEYDYPIHNAWRYRDYVIRAFNADLPYDRFVTEHIAGDLLPNPRRHPTEHFNESVIGTGFFWLGQRDHSPVDVRQHQAEFIDNQIDVMCKTFLGLTVACARCHDHKFDAIAAKDFYALYGVLESSRYTQKQIDSAAAPQIERLKALKREIRRVAINEWSKQDKLFSPESLGRWTSRLGARMEAGPRGLFYPWLKLSSGIPKSPQQFREQWQLLLQEASSTEQSRGGTNGRVFAHAVGGHFEGWFVDGDAFAAGCGGEGDFMIGATNVAILHRPAVNDSVISRRLEGSLRSPGFEIRQGYAHILAAGRDSRIRICVDNFTMIRDPIYGGLMKQLANDKTTWVTFDLRMWQGHRAYIELCDTSTPDPSGDVRKDSVGGAGWLSASEVVFADDAKPPAATDSAMWLQLLGPQAPNSLEALALRYEAAFQQGLRTWKSGEAELTNAEQVQLAFLDWMLENGLLEITAGSPKERHALSESSAGVPPAGFGGVPPPAERGEIPGEDARLTRRRDARATLSTLKEEKTQRTTGRLAGLLAEYRRIESSISPPIRVPAMTDGTGFDEHVFIRGNHATPGDLAPRQFLTALSHEKDGRFTQGSGRLELAGCLTDSSDPLLARVMVNRVWLHLFGRGIVPTPDDFGKLGQPPSHPQLLDWLANWYRTDAGWSTKKLVRLLVTSSSYRMSSKPADLLAEEKDADNTLLHRMPIRRLEGEALRDSMLAVSGGMDPKMFGPSVPTHLTEFMEGRGRPTSNGPLDGARRRSIYLEVRRNFLAPMMRTFDTPVPFTTVGRRTVSNVPAQSLILLNNPFVLGQAQLWANRLLNDPKCSPEQRINRIYWAAFGRPATADELRKASEFIQLQSISYGIGPPEYLKDERVWADLCHVTFNVKEFAFVE